MKVTYMHACESTHIRIPTHMPTPTYRNEPYKRFTGLLSKIKAETNESPVSRIYTSIIFKFWIINKILCQFSYSVKYSLKLYKSCGLNVFSSAINQ